MSWVLRAMRALKVVGSPSASSSALVCSDCVPPIVAAMASTAVRTTLLYGSCSDSEYLRPKAEVSFLAAAPTRGTWGKDAKGAPTPRSGNACGAAKTLRP
jgi:hypothetical protein